MTPLKVSSWIVKRSLHSTFGVFGRGFSSAAAQLEKNSSSEDGTSKMNMLQAINNALDIAMENDESAVIFGEDVGFGGVFRCSLNLQVIFGRIPIFSEQHLNSISII